MYYFFFSKKCVSQKFRGEGSSILYFPDYGPAEHNPFQVIFTHTRTQMLTWHVLTLDLPEHLFSPIEHNEENNNNNKNGNKTTTTKTVIKH